MQDHRVFSYLTVFFLMFPGLVTSVGFVVLHCLGANRAIGGMPPRRVAAVFLVLLLFYPAVPIAL